MEIKRGDIFYANLGRAYNTSEQKGVRPVVVIQNNSGNRYSSTVIVSPLTSKLKKTNLPVHIYILKDNINHLKYNSVLLLEQIITIDKVKLTEKIGTLDRKILSKVNKALKISLNLEEDKKWKEKRETLKRE